MNVGLLLLQITLICWISVCCLHPRLGEKSLNAWLCILAISMNLFVTKSINIGSMEVTATDALAVGYMLGLCLIQEYYGKKAARQHVLISFIVSIGFLGLSLIHLRYTPNSFDTMDGHFQAILSPMPRLIFASLASFILIQLFDITFFQWIRKQCKGKYFAMRAGICVILSQILDTFIFSFLGLYGSVANLKDIILLSLILKIIVAVIATPFVFLTRYININAKQEGEPSCNNIF